MTIKEIETLAGMTRANIRFYEKEGFLEPERGENKYRDYSENDLETLQRIKLLRSLRLPLSEIKALHSGEEKLGTALERHIETLGEERASIVRAEEVCREMRDDHADYSTLDARRYLDELERSQGVVAEVLAEDVVKEERAPIRRFIARSIDVWLYDIAWTIFIILAFNVNITTRGAEWRLLDTAVPIVMMLFIEPLFLRLFKTTPGKWIFGLRVTDDRSRRLRYSDALLRTWTVLWNGLGLYIPIYSLVRQWKCYSACERGETLEWEYDSAVTLRPRRGWVAFAMVVAYIGATFAGLFCSVVNAGMPRYRGQLTTAEFCENFNRIASYYGVDFGKRLDDTGHWVEYPWESGTYYVYEFELPDFEITETDGAVTRVEFSFETTDGSFWAPSFRDQMMVAAISFVCAQDGFALTSAGWKELSDTILSHQFEDFHFERGGIVVESQVEYEHYLNAGDMLIPDEDEATFYSFSFSITTD